MNLKYIVSLVLIASTVIATTDTISLDDLIALEQLDRIDLDMIAAFYTFYRCDWRNIQHLNSPTFQECKKATEKIEQFIQAKMADRTANIRPDALYLNQINRTGKSEFAKNLTQELSRIQEEINNLKKKI